jgi:hypothetical protein
MNTQLIFEIVGYIASVLVAVSLTMSSILKLRLINLAGAAIFSLYGLLIGAYPVAALNFFIVLIDLYFLYDMLTAKEYFKLLDVRAGNNYLDYFLTYYQEEMQKYFPGYEFKPENQQIIFFVLRNMVPAGLFIGRKTEGDALEVELDFVIPGYRDFKIGHYLYEKNSAFFRSKGIQRIHTRAATQKHSRYLKRMGFIPGRGNQFFLKLAS